MLGDSPFQKKRGRRNGGGHVTMWVSLLEKGGARWPTGPSVCSNSGAAPGAGASGAGFAREMLECPFASAHLGRGAESLWSLKSKGSPLMKVQVRWSSVQKHFTDLVENLSRFSCCLPWGSGDIPSPFSSSHPFGNQPITQRSGFQCLSGLLPQEV